jgi:hypothetical protein
MIHSGHIWPSTVKKGLKGHKTAAPCLLFSAIWISFQTWNPMSVKTTLIHKIRQNFLWILPCVKMNPKPYFLAQNKLTHWKSSLLFVHTHNQIPGTGLMKEINKLQAIWPNSENPLNRKYKILNPLLGYTHRNLVISEPDFYEVNLYWISAIPPLFE